MARSYPDFQTLIESLVNRYIDERKIRRGAAVRAFAHSINVAPSLVYHWLSGHVATPNPRNVSRLCEVYSLDLPTVWGLLVPKRPAGAAALPLPVDGRRGSSDKKRYRPRHLSPVKGKKPTNIGYLDEALCRVRGLTILRGSTPFVRLPRAA